jgi:molybdopterin-containing oxidoreductase family iron-sulfur binding subunit
LLTNTLASPSTEKLIADFLAATSNAKHVIYDAVSSEALDAFEAVYGERALLITIFKSIFIVSVVQISCDWQGGGYDSGYAKGRILKPKMSRHSVRGEYDFVWCCC